MKERSVSQATTVTNLSGFGVNASGRKYKTNTEAALQNNTEYEEINYSVDVNETKIWAENIVNSLKSFFIDKSKYTSVYERMGIDEETAYFMDKDVERYKPLLVYANKFLDFKTIKEFLLISELIKDGLNSDIMKILKFFDIKVMNDLIIKDIGNGIRLYMYDGTFLIVNSNGISFKYSDGLCTNIYYPNGVLVEFLYDANGELYDVNYYSGKEEPISIYGEYTELNEQYGGSQSDFKNNNAELLQDPIILKMLKETYPEADMEDYECYLSALCEHGCGYTAFINMVFENFEGREDEFQKTFGFPMYTVDDKGNIDFNYEYLILDLFNYIWGNSGYTIKELYGYEDFRDDPNIVKTVEKITGTYDSDYGLANYWNFASWLKEKYGIDIRVNIVNKNEMKIKVYKGTQEYEEIAKSAGITYNADDFFYKSTKDFKKYIEEQLKDSNKVIVGLGGFDLYYPDGSEIYTDDLDPHAMSVVEVTELGIIVSSWGQRYLIKYEDLTNGTLDVFEYEE